jgi:hypothetical protein
MGCSTWPAQAWHHLAGAQRTVTAARPSLGKRVKGNAGRAASAFSAAVVATFKGVSPLQQIHEKKQF